LNYAPSSYFDKLITGTQDDIIQTLDIRFPY
jgi:hypothetical protein